MSGSPSILAHPLIEPLPEARQTGLRIKSFQKDCVDFHWHFHPEIELIHVRRGSGVRYVGRSLQPFSAGDFCLIGANVPHAFGSCPAERRGAEWMVGHFLPEVWGTTFWELPEMRRVAGLLAKAQRGIRFDAGETSRCVEMFSQLEQTPAGALRLGTWLEILDRLAHSRRQRCLNPVSTIAGKTDARLQRVLAWVEENAGDPALTQARAAQASRMSPQAFCRFFREGTARTFQRHVSEVRVARACVGLLNSNRGVSDIAFEAGFNNLSNFNRRFREITGYTPRLYRQMEGGFAGKKIEGRKKTGHRPGVFTKPRQ
ncbi:MAG: helix-turn-helix domain-containing protein [Terrimicrobiaceae bacterium]